MLLTNMMADAMQRAAGILFCTVLFTNAAMLPQTRADTVDEIDIGQDAYAFHGGVTGKIRTFQSDSEAQDVVRQVLNSIGLPLRFEIRAAPIPNAQAVLTKAGKRLILYNTIFMEEIKQRTGKYWSQISIMAHEIGHHLSFHMSSQIGDHDAELEADYFSGYVLAKLGSPMDDALAAMRELGSDANSSTHPGRTVRLQAIAAGWKNASAGTGIDLAAVKGIPEAAPSSTTPREAQPANIHQPRPRSSAGRCAPASGGGSRHVYCVSSLLATSGVNKSNYGPESLFDGDDGTAWVEGNTASGDYGVGEWLVVELGARKKVKGIAIKNGYSKSDRIFRINGRVREAELVFSNGERKGIVLDDRRESQDTVFDPPIEAEWVQLRIVSANAGGKYSDTAINEFRVITTAD